MRSTILRRIRPSWRIWIWVGYLLLGLALTGQAIVLIALASLVVSPAHFETIRSFNAIGIVFTALSALMIGIFWLYQGVSGAFRQLSRFDHETSERLRKLFSRHKEAPRFALVALGGGTGLSTLLKGLKELPRIDLTAVVTVTDDGGSSGRLRHDLQILPPGDIRNCLVALSRSESLLSQLFQYRFREGGGIAGHSFGNLFIAAMTEVLGDFGSAVQEASNILAIRGNVVPVTVDQVELVATFDNGERVQGETAIAAVGGKIVSIGLEPSTSTPNPDALLAINEAGMIVLGPGSLFTSIIPNLLVPGVAAAINQSSAHVIYVCNVMTQHGETDQFSAYDHVKVLLDQTPLKHIDTVLVNARRATRPIMERYEAQCQFWVPPTVLKIEALGIRVISADLLQDSDLLRHNPVALATRIFGLINETTLATEVAGTEATAAADKRLSAADVDDTTEPQKCAEK